ncbi:MAG: type II toxin-antitoxin system VapC family toxin [Acidobacteriota bacterium]
MIVDSSAVVCVLMREPEYERVIKRLVEAEFIGIGAPTLTETGIVVLARFPFDPLGRLSRFMQEFGISVVPFGEAHWQEAVDAYARYGKGRHPAALNFGDCLSYATSKLAAQPLLCTGDDFAQTDLELA